MKKIIFLSIVFCALLVYFPFSAQAEDPYFSDIHFAADSYLAGAVTDVIITVTVAAELAANDTFYVTFADDQNTTPNEIGFDFTQAEITYSVDGLECIAPAEAPALLRCTVGQAIAIGNFTIDIEAMSITETANIYRSIITTDEPGSNANYTINEGGFTVEELITPKKKKISMVKQSNGKHKIKYTATNLNGNFYKAKLKGKKLKKNNYKKIRTYKHLTSLSKKGKKSYFKGKKFFKVQWKNCYRYQENTATDICSSWSKAREFKRTKSKFKVI